MKLTDNTILITGGTSGIGRALAERLTAMNNQVIICGRREERLDEVARSNGRITTRRCDISRASDREELARWVSGEFPQLNVLINNAGIQLAADLRRPMEMEKLDAEVSTNLTAPIHLTTLLLGRLMGRPNAAVVNISSGLAFAPIAGMPVYCATKAAIHSFSLSLRRQLRDTPVEVYEIAPPSVDTELGYQHRNDGSRSHGGMAVAEFVEAALQALEQGTLEAAIGPAAGMRSDPEQAFARMNG
ncbi:SDR family oxidoreductase [Salinispira pacifica]